MLANDLRRLINEVVLLVDSFVSEKKIYPSEETMFRWKINNFNYTENGPKYSGASGEYFIHKHWRDAIVNIESIVKETDLYDFILSNHNITIHQLLSLIRKIIELRLDAKDINIDYLIETFIKDLRNEPVICGAIVDLNGIVIESEKIVIKLPESVITIRQAYLEDLEDAQSLFCAQHFPKHIHSVLEINCLCTEGIFVQDCVEKYTAILRLYCVGSVDFTEYKIFSESITNRCMSGRLGKDVKNATDKKYYIKACDEVKLIKFVKILNDKLPKDFYNHNNTSKGHLHIAHDRYCKALLDRISTFEQRITDTVMGLESLYLMGAENTEIIYKLSIRMAKLFSFFGCINVTNIIKDAYTIRSHYVHGSQLNDKAKAKYSDKYGNNMDELLLTTLDFLRISIICFILIDKEKDELINIIDKSFYDDSQSVLFGSLLTPSIKLIK